MFNSTKITSETSTPIRESINDSVLTQHQEVDEHEDPVKSDDVRVFIISFANLKDKDD